MNDFRTSEKLLAIGEFAKRTRLSSKALRLYDGMGLLEPAYIDPNNQYRYYSEAQIEKAKLIALLRQLEMPLNRIADVIDQEGKALTQEIALYWQEVEEDVRTKRKLVHYLKNYLSTQGDNMFKIEMRDVVEQQVLSIKRNIYQPALTQFIEEAGGQLYSQIGKSGQEAIGAMSVIYHGKVDADSDGPVEICVPFTGQIEAGEGMVVRLEPTHKEAYVTITKAQLAFPDILAAYDAVACHLDDDASKEISGPPRELYFADWNAIADDDPACDIAFPYTEQQKLLLAIIL